MQVHWWEALRELAVHAGGENQLDNLINKIIEL